MKILHISLDDTKGIFKAVCSNKMDSIFETRTLSFLKEMHIKYDAVFTLFCTYSDGAYEMSKVSDAYINEFKENSGWLRFGFHCYREDYEYIADSAEEFMKYYEMFQAQTARITGQAEPVKILRLHGFQGSLEMCRFLKEKGTAALLAADDGRNSYYLNEKENEDLRNLNYFYDKMTGLEFVKSCTRLENSTDVIQELDERKKGGGNLIPVFTHEWQMDRADIREKFELCCKWGVENCGN